MIETDYYKEKSGLQCLSRRILFLASTVFDDDDTIKLLALFDNVIEAIESLENFESFGVDIYNQVEYKDEDEYGDLKHSLGFEFAEKIADIEDIIEELAEEGYHLHLH